MTSWTSPDSYHTYHYCPDHWLRVHSIMVAAQAQEAERRSQRVLSYLGPYLIAGLAAGAILGMALVGLVR